ncbi:unnamed protein product [Trichogramma brassicae]|uniref:Uncharacterized protein n=1 Tax=Trichogramma brassicae TaxID=86971 RepID=A0A6H5HXA7_9HYME|nr:unnamed protein product [Trichogramma brassicae]
MKRLREAVDWSDLNSRREFICQLASLIKGWKSRLPNLRVIFQPREINAFLIDAVEILFERKNKIDGSKIITFVVSTGYKDKPDFDANNRPLLNRCTPLHTMVRLGHVDKAAEIVRKLFKIYDKFDVNYIGPKGRTHLHVACQFGLAHIVRKFLDSRQDINCRDLDKNTPLLVALKHPEHDRGTKVVRLLLERGANVALADRRRKTPLHIICGQLNDNEEHYDLIERLFKINEDKRQGMRVNARDKKGCTALRLALDRGHAATVALLLRRGADPTLPDAKRVTPLHAILREGDENWTRLFLEVIGELPRRQQRRQTSRVDAQWKRSTPLHVALECANRDWVKWLLRRGASPNLPNREGRTSFHLISKPRRPNDTGGYYKESALVKSFFAAIDEAQPRRLLWLDFQDKRGNTPLLWALECYSEIAFEALLRRGADPNLANDKGQTALHIICKRRSSFRHAELLFRICDENDRALEIDARDKEGCTPLHLALLKDKHETAKLLLRRGASPNLADEQGSTPLHVICMKDDEDLEKMFFEINAERKQLVMVDERDKEGRTPLQWAVANLKPRTVERLLDRGTKLSSFAFPTESYFAQCHWQWILLSLFEFALIARALAVVDCLESRGYEFCRCEVLTIMKFFDEHKIFDASTDLENDWLDDESFVCEAEKLMIKPCLSLRDLLQLRPEVAAKQFTHREYYQYFQSSVDGLSWQSRELCTRHLCEIMCRKFFWDWALDCLVELTHFRLPAICCEMIMDNLMNKDLLNICLAAGEPRRHQ